MAVMGSRRQTTSVHVVVAHGHQRSDSLTLYKQGISPCTRSCHLYVTAVWQAWEKRERLTRYP